MLISHCLKRNTKRFREFIGGNYLHTGIINTIYRKLCFPIMLFVSRQDLIMFTINLHYRLERIVFVKDVIRTMPVTMYIWTPLSTKPQSIKVLAKDTIIVGRDMAARTAVKNAIKPKGIDGRTISRRRR